MAYGRYLLPVILVLAGCEKDKPAQRTIEPTAPPVDPLVTAVQEVVKACTVTPVGELRKCKKPGVARQLKKIEKTKGTIPSLTQYCKLLESKKPSVRSLAAVRIGALSYHRALKNEGNPELLKCLLSSLEKKRDKAAQWQAERIVRAATFLATARGKHEALIDYLDTNASPQVRRVGYECLWTNGGLRVIEALERGAKSEEPKLRRSVAMGFTYVDHLGGAEREKVCPMLEQLSGDKQSEVAGPATLQLTRLCVDRHDTVLKTIARKVARKKVALEMVNALDRILSSAKPPPTDTQRKKATMLLARISRLPEPRTCAKCPKPREPSITRVSALRFLSKVEPKKASRLARRLKIKLN